MHVLFYFSNLASVDFSPCIYPSRLEHICDPGAVLSRWGIFVAIAKNTLNGSKL